MAGWLMVQETPCVGSCGSIDFSSNNVEMDDVEERWNELDLLRRPSALSLLAVLFWLLIRRWRCQRVRIPPLAGEFCGIFTSVRDLHYDI